MLVLAKMIQRAQNTKKPHSKVQLFNLVKYNWIQLGYYI